VNLKTKALVIPAVVGIATYCTLSLLGLPTAAVWCGPIVFLLCLAMYLIAIREERLEEEIRKSHASQHSDNFWSGK
jgi:hypothetical protein